MQTVSTPRIYQLFAGIDVSAATVTVSWMRPDGRPSRAQTIEQTAEGYAELQALLLATGVAPQSTLVVLEATGSYWITLATVLAEAQFVVSVINPAQAHDFAKALLKRAKTDALDAQMLAELGARLRPEPWTPPPAVYAELQQRLMQREALVQIRTQVRNQRHALLRQPNVIADVQRRMDELLETLDEQITEVEREIAVALRQDAAWAAAAERLQTIPGIARLTASWILVTTLNFTLCSTPEAAASHAGLVPYVRASGSSVRGRAQIGQAGNRHLRRALYLASFSAVRHNPIIKSFYDRLRAAGKPPKVARCAAARKLLHIAWAVVTKEQNFDPEYQLLSQMRAAA
jgi:transposase